MKLNRLIRLVDGFYPDGLVGQHWDFRAEQPLDAGAGDTLALFIARELSATFDPDAGDREQIAAAVTAMERAAEELGTVVAGLLRHRRRRSASGAEPRTPQQKGYS